MVDYFLKNGQRHVVPAWASNSINSKGQWYGRQWRDVSRELRFGGKDWTLVRRGSQKPIDLVTNPQIYIRDGDIIKYQVHRHEPPVNPNVVVLAENDNVLVVDKPSGLPVHPTGSYYNNSMTEILTAMGHNNHFLWNRLDKLTSGIMVIGKRPSVASQMQADMQAGKIVKEYLAKVNGKFVENTTSTTPLYDFNALRPYYRFQRSARNSKPAVTHFHRVSYNEVADESIVRCTPVHGRTHQIRKHLAILGYPIVNDPIYSDGLFRKLYTDEDQEAAYQLLHDKAIEAKELMFTGETCSECGEPIVESESQVLYLHATRYFATDGSWSYETLPEWMPK